MVPGLEPGTFTLDTERPCLGEGDQLPMLYPSELQFVQNRLGLPDSPMWHRTGTFFFSHARRWSLREQRGPDTGHTTGHWQDLLAGF